MSTWGGDPIEDHLQNLDAAATTLRTQRPDPFLYKRYSNSDGSTTCRFFTHHGVGDDECGMLLHQLAGALALPEVYAASGAASILTR
jgi:hypothetical protein